MQNCNITCYCTWVETWSVTLREEHRLRVFEDGVLRGHLGKEEVAGDCTKLYNWELCDKYSLPNIVWVFKSKPMEWAWHVAHMGQKRNAYTSWL
jgi:hypothetical protein